MGAVVLGDDQQAGGAAVEPVHDPRPQHAAHAGEVADAREQRIDERAAGRAGTGVDDEPRRLVDHEQRGVLVHDPQRDVLGLRLGGRGGRHAHHGALPEPDAGGGARRGRVDLDLAGRDQRLQAGARQLRQAAREPRVETLSGLVGPDDQLVGLGQGSRRQAVARACVRRSRGSSTAVPSSRTMAMTWEVESAPPNQEPRSGSPRRNSRPKRTAE